MDIAQSRVSIANICLAKLGMNITSTLTPSESAPEITALNAIYDQIRDDLLRKHPWTFAQKTVLLATLAITPVDFGDGATIVYGYPDDFINPNLWNNQYALIRLESDGIHSDTTGLAMKYTYANDDPGSYSPDFIQAFGVRLAYELCENFTQSRSKKENLGKEYLLKLGEAMANDSQLGTPIESRCDEWFAMRLAGMGGVPGVGSNNVGF